MQTTVLIVTDEARLRPTLKAALEQRGYSVVAVRSSLQAFVAAAKQPIDALITKVELEGVQGRDLGRIMSERFPGLAVIYLSGSPDADAIAGELGGQLEARKKPASRRARGSGESSQTA